MTFRRVCPLVARTLFAVPLIVASIPSLAADAPAEEAIRRAIAANEASVVQLRYFGAGDDTLGAAAAPVTGYALDDAWVVTSTYALDAEPAAIVCRFEDGRQSQARVAARDHSRCVALLRLEGARRPAAFELPSRPARVGETTIALGRVYAADSVNVAVGVVSAVGRLGGRAVQTDALASPANYGGPLLALDGSLLGIIVPLAPPGQDGVNLYDSGVGFAVTTEQLSERLPTLAAGDDIRVGWMGVSLPNDDPLRAAPQLLKVTKEGPADLTGLSAGDTIVSLAGAPTPTVWALRSVAAGLDAGTTVEVAVRRRGLQEPSPDRRTITLGEQPAPPEQTQEADQP